METSGGRVTVTPTPRGPTRWGNQLNGNLVSVWPASRVLIAPLAGAISWMETLGLGLKMILRREPHSLGQSVEWKPLGLYSFSSQTSLEAPLAGAISWMETALAMSSLKSFGIAAPLAGAISWMETMETLWHLFDSAWAPLAGAISWMETLNPKQ